MISLVFFVCTILGIPLSTSWLTGYVPDAEERENPDMPFPESIRNVERKISHDCACGISDSRPANETEAMLANDTLALPAEFPWTVYLRINNSLPGPYSRATKELRGRNWTWEEREGHHDCVGTVINDLFIVTSSSCILNYYPNIDSPLSQQIPFLTWIRKTREIKPSEIYAYVNLTFKTAGSVSQYKIIDKIFYHAQTSYATRNFRPSEESDYDIALLKLKYRLTFGFNPNFAPICLPKPEIVKDYNTIYTFVNGWYSRPKDFQRANENRDKLHKTAPRTIHDNCERVYGNGTYTSNYLCSSDPLKYMDAGSSLVSKTKHNRAFLLGVLSWILPHYSGNYSITQNQNIMDNYFRLGLFSKMTSKPIQSFIDYHSKREGATWCTDPETIVFHNSPSNGYEEPPPGDGLTNVLDTCECGKTIFSEVNPKIVGGEKTTPFEFPWLVYLFIKNPDTPNSGGACGASIINDRLLLTAAHCVATEPPKNSGNTRRLIASPDRILAVFHTYAPGAESQQQKRPFTIINVQKVIVHAGYLDTKGKSQNDLYVGDIALLVLERRIDITNRIFNPICLPRKNDEITITEGRDATVTGSYSYLVQNTHLFWTRFDDNYWTLFRPHLSYFILGNNYFSNALSIIKGWGQTSRDFEQGAPESKKIVVPLHTNEVCLKYLPGRNMTHFLCADEILDDTGAGKGDSGGPLFIELPSKDNIQIGVVSHGVNPPKGSEDKYGFHYLTFYTRITYFREWIEHYAVAYEAKWCKRASDPT